MYTILRKQSDNTHEAPAMHRPSLKKQITLIVDLCDWQRLSREAARLRISLTELCRRELAPLLDRLLQSSASALPADPEDRSAQPGPHRPRNASSHPWKQPLTRSPQAQPHQVDE